MLKKCVSVLLVLLMLIGIFTVVPLTASAEEVLDNGVYQYVIVTPPEPENPDDPVPPTTVRITKYLKDEENVVIPSVIDGYDVTCIGEDAFSDRSGKALKTVKIPDTVTAIGKYAFHQCMALESVTLYEGLESIDYGAFWICPKLESIRIPDTVTSLGYSALRGNASLTTVVLGAGVTSIGNDMLRTCSNLTTVIFRADEIHLY